MITRKKKILIIVVIVMLILFAILGGVFAFLYFKTDLLRTNQELFYKYALQNEDIINVIDDNWLNEYKNKTSTTAYNNSGEITFNIDNDNNESQLNTMVNNIKFKFEGSTNLPEGKTYQDIKVLYSDENKELFNVKLLKEDELYGVKSDEILIKYLSVKNEDIKQLYNRLGIENSNNIANNIEEYDFNTILNMSETNKTEISERYMSVLNTHIPSSRYSKEKDARVTVNNEVYVANKYSVKLTGDEYINVKIKLLEALLDDDTTLNEIIKILQKDDTYITILKTKIQETIENIKREPTNENVALEISVYELDGKLLKTECINETQSLTIENINSGNTQNVKIVNTNTNNGVIVDTYVIKRNSSESENSLTYNVISTENGRQASEVLVELKNEGNINSNNIDTSINISINNDLGKNKIEYVNKKEFNVQTQIESLSEDTVTLNNTTIEYNKNLIQAIKDRLLSIYAERASSVGLDSNTLTSEIQYTIKTYKEQFNRDEFEKQVQRSLNYVKQDASVDLEFAEKLQKATTAEEKQRIKEERLVKRLNEFGINAKSDEENKKILIDSGYNYNYIYYIDYDKYTVTRAE